MSQIKLRTYASMSNKRDDSSQSKTYCGGRFVTGPDNGYFYLTLVLMYAPHVPFLVLVCPYFSDKITPVVYAIPGYLLLFATAMLFLAAFTDPGIIPRGTPIPEPANPFALESKPPLVKKHLVKGVELESKWCDSCDVYRPIRTSHCGICNNCVQNFDHHCPWLGNCIGRRNYRYYLLYIIACTLECMYIIALCIAHIVLNVNASTASTHSDQVRDGFGASYYFAIILPVYAVAGLGFVGGLTGFHCFLVGNGLSTNEYIKKTFRHRKNPHSHGLLRNYFRAFFPPGFPTLYVPRPKETVAPIAAVSV